MPYASLQCLMPYALCFSAVALALAHTFEEVEREELSLKLRFAFAGKQELARGDELKKADLVCESKEPHSQEGLLARLPPLAQSMSHKT